MYLHLGGDIVVNENSIVAIMDLETTSVSKITKEYFKKITADGSVIDISSEDLPKSFVITEEKGKRKVYISPISSRTLTKRSEEKLFLEQ